MKPLERRVEAYGFSQEAQERNGRVETLFRITGKEQGFEG
jgi:hypothetical protein